MPTLTFADRTLDARPDRVDLRDRPYQPRLTSLPSRYPDAEFIKDRLPTYTAAGLILDQGQEGACTGFGLAAVVNYLFWVDPVRWAACGGRRVSPRMLYHLARFYDEWPGEDYSGSSCRGAMKGWHRHGVCDETRWPYVNAQGEWAPPLPDWETDGATRPLGAYYRIDKSSINDLQAALYEVGAIYASADVHAGWFANAWSTSADGIATITVGDPATVGGHAFALVGYTAEGFIVQNSWGPAWGTRGFAILPYDDWVERGADAWVAVLGAPTVSGRERTPVIVTPPRDGRVSGFWSVDRPVTVTREHAGYRPWTEREAYGHCVVMGNNGVVLNRLPDAEHALAALEHVASVRPGQWLDPVTDRVRIVLYAHGGLNDEAASVRRARTLGPYFHANGVYPIFLTWKTGVLETLGGILEDHVQSLVAGPMARGAWDTIKEAVQEAKDRLVEAACQGLRVKAIWTEMKQNAAAAATEHQSTLGEVVAHLAALKRSTPKLELHLVGHSAGAILLGHLLDVLRTRGGTRGLTASTCTLFAPACTVDFALQHYLPAVGSVLPGAGALEFQILTDERERADAVGPYGKSLLYLISRGLESHHKTPVLGMASVWEPPVPDQWGNARLAQQVATWRAAWPGGAVMQGAQGDASDGVQSMPWLHGTFDNDVAVVRRTIERILGPNGKLVAPIKDLSGY